MFPTAALICSLSLFVSFILPNHKIHIYIHTHSCTGTYIHYIYSYSCTQAHVCGHETTATPLGLSRLISWCGPISRQDAHPGADGVIQASGPLLPPWRLLKERLNLPCYLGLLCEPELESLFWFLSRKKKKVWKVYKRKNFALSPSSGSFLPWLSYSSVSNHTIFWLLNEFSVLCNTISPHRSQPSPSFHSYYIVHNILLQVGKCKGRNFSSHRRCHRANVFKSVNKVLILGMAPKESWKGSNGV